MAYDRLAHIFGPWHPWFASEHAVNRCDASSGHTVAPVAFCDKPERAQFIARACNAHAELIGAAEDALSALIACCVPSGGVDDAKAVEYAKARLHKALQAAGQDVPALPSGIGIGGLA